MAKEWSDVDISVVRDISRKVFDEMIETAPFSKVQSDTIRSTVEDVVKLEIREINDKVSLMSSKLDTLDGTLATFSNDVTILNNIMLENKGSKKTALAIGSAVGSVVSIVIVALLNYFLR